MVVYGKDKVKYDLDKAIRSVGCGKDYHVSGREETLIARIYDRSARNRAREEEVRQSLEGMAEMAENPVDILYKNSRFAGFLYYDYSLEAKPEAAQTMETQDAYETQPRGSVSVPPALIVGIEVVILSLLVRFLLYPYLDQFQSEWLLKLSVGGITQIAFGVIVLGIAYSKWFTNTANIVLTGLGSAIAYIVGAAGITCLMVMVIRILTTAVEIAMYILPSVILIVVLIAVLKSMFSK